jgi:methionyl-tRNA synthetase
MENKKFYITTSIPYTNAAPHIGHAFELIQADVLARYHRSLNEDTFFLTGTDEHGLKTLRAAEAEGKTAEEFASETSGKFKELAKILNTSNDDFIRTTDEQRHKPAIYKLWEKYKESGDIYKKKYKGYYCPGCEAFKTEKEIIDEKCIIHQKVVEIIEEENYFFKLSKYLPEIKKAIEDNKLKIIPESKKNETLGMIEKGMEDISFSRMKDKYWGWPVPEDPTQNLYVWVDALPNYISAIGYANETEQFKKYWPVDVHCIGKDIMKFHTILWPAMLLSAGLELPKSVFVHGFINVGGQKMSKSLGNVINPTELVEKYGTDAVRYYLLREIPAMDDGDFTIEKFEQRYNADLAGGIGNLVARTVTMAGKLQVESLSSYKVYKVTNEKLGDEIEKTKNTCNKALSEFKFNEALIVIWELISVCDKYINETQPWSAKTPAEVEKAKEVLIDLLFTISQIADLLIIFLPQTSQKIKEILKSGKSEILFPRLIK